MTETPVEHTPDLYKKWFRSKTASGFLSVRVWPEALKCSIDIGAVDLETKKVLGSTLVWADMIELIVFLRFETGGGYQSFGGGMVDGRPVSRLFKTEGAAGGTWWKTGHFEATQPASGAFIPKMDKPISQNQIKVSRTEELEIAYRLDLFLHGYAAQNPMWFYPTTRD